MEIDIDENGSIRINKELNSLDKFTIEFAEVLNKLKMKLPTTASGGVSKFMKS